MNRRPSKAVSAMVCEWDDTTGSYFHGWRHGVVLEVTLL